MTWEFSRPSHLLLALAPLALAGCVSLKSAEREGDGKTVQTAKGSCTFLAPENQLHALAGCESAQGYLLQVGDRQHVYAKDDFQKNLRERIWQFLRTTSYPEAALSGATVEVWLEAKTFEPDAAELRVVVLGPGGNFALPLAVDMDQWEVLAADVQRLGKDRYPSRGAKRLGVVAVMARNEVSPARLKAFVESTGVLAAKTKAGRLAVTGVAGEAPLLTLSTEPFAEPDVARRLMGHRAAKSYLNDVRYVSAGEFEGYKARVFAFNW